MLPVYMPRNSSVAVIVLTVVLLTLTYQFQHLFDIQHNDYGYSVSQQEIPVTEVLIKNIKRPNIKRVVVRPSYNWSKTKEDDVHRNVTDPCVLDPLKDDCALGLTGFIDKPLTIENARLCDGKLNPHLGANSEVLCPQDPTCKKCKFKYIQRNEKLRAAFLSTSKERKNRLARWFPVSNNTNSRTVIVCSVNYGQLYLFLNWACSCLANGVFDPREYVWMVPTDNETYDTLNNLGFHVEPLDWKVKDINISATYGGGSNVGSHPTINNLISHAACFAVYMGYHTLMMDVDLVFLKNPFPYLEKALIRRDFLGMYAPRNDMYGFVNAGFMYFNPTAKTKLLVKSYENLSILKSNSDQQLWNTVFRHNLLQQIEYRILPRALFFPLWKSTNKYGYHRNKTYVLHTISGHKAPRLAEHGHWYLDSKCPFFDKAAEDVALRRNLIQPKSK
mmetsp:Transcript_8175/g.9665  ORF Transcript_8175/g.9665 Transcript_8175/m.9665 type:complete len:446 (+) Transcript_8175:158-1495(+)